MRKYAGEQESIWGGTPECKHSWLVSKRQQSNNNGTGKSTLEGRGEKTTGVDDGLIETNTCYKCGAWRGAYGLEPTPALYVQHTVEILMEIRRVLRKDGVCFWNIDDSYASGFSTSDNKYKAMSGAEPNMKFDKGIIKPKDLCLIPFRVAIAAQEDGWWIRSVIIWNKPNPMPESVTDRPTGSHEYILMLTKSAKYYWDMEAVREPHQTEPGPLRDKANEGYGEAYLTPIGSGLRTGYSENGRNLRDVWTFPTQPYPNAHFATYPEKLPELCIKAASKEGDTVLEPFCGSGTTLEVAAKLNRKAVGYEISKEYCQLIVERNNQSVLL